MAQDSIPSGTDDTATSAGADTSGLDLNMNLEQLTRQDVVVPGFSTPVTTVERQPSTVGRTPAAVFVITPEMIKRTGARTIPDALRCAPGVDVARINAHTWAISIRGFNAVFANKLLVQIDGRVVYNATFGGVYWNQQDVVLEDVERIEVIRGPGTTMWGSNAVNGVINIITKKTCDTQGILVQSGGGGQDQRDFNTVRFGGQLTDDTTYRVWSQQFDRAAGWSADPINSNDAWHGQHGGFRTDFTPNDEETLTLQGDLFSGYGGARYDLALPTPPFGGLASDTVQFPASNLLLRYSRVIDDETSWQLQTYYDHFQQLQLETPVLQQTRDTWDIDFQMQFSPWERHNFVAGANYRRSPDSFTNSFGVGFEPPQFTTEWAGVFLQDNITLEEDRWYFALGCRLEYNTFGKFQAEPTARLLFLPSDRQSLWFAVSRAVRNPMRVDVDVYFNRHIGGPGVPLYLDVLGNPELDPENLMAYEIGYRAAPTDQFSWDIAGYINDYRKVRGLGPIGAPVVQPPYVFLPTRFENNTSAISYGFETTLTYQVNDCWRWFASYSLFEVTAEGPDVEGNLLIEGSNPHNMVYLRSSRDLWSNVQWDVMGRYVDSLTALDVPKYFEMDTRIGWQITDSLELSFVGQNLMNGHHLEFRDVQSGIIATEVRRSWYGMLTWTY
jgi:iron complex outermembrane receptor protein